MTNTNPAVDVYISKAPEFARPILEKVRKAFHKGCPQVEEVIKWGAPHFEHNGLLGGMVAFRQHVGFGFWRGHELDDPQNLFEGKGGSACTAKFAKLKDLPTQKVIVDFVRQAAALNAGKTKKPRAKLSGSVVKPPADLVAGLKRNVAAKKTFAELPRSKQRDYVQWLTEAKQDATRKRRLATTIEWLSEGKSRNWKYSRSGK